MRLTCQIHTQKVALGVMEANFDRHDTDKESIDLRSAFPAVEGVYVRLSPDSIKHRLSKLGAETALKTNTETVRTEASSTLAFG